MKDCIFCKIVRGEIPCCKVYEDEFVLAFLDIAPVNLGHILVIPKAHHTSSATIPEEVAGRMFRAGARLGVAQKRALDAHGYNLHLNDGSVAGQEVMHAHLHIIPRWTDDQFHFNWRQLKYSSMEEMQNHCAEIIKSFQFNPAADEKTGDEE